MSAGGSVAAVSRHTVRAGLSDADGHIYGTYGATFALAIICTILLDVTTQLNIWSIIGVSGMRGQDIANKVIPGPRIFHRIFSWLWAALCSTSETSAAERRD